MTNITSSLNKRAAANRNWTEGSVIQNIFLLSWPMIILALLYTVNLIFELIWLGRLGAASIAGVGIAGFVVVLVITIKTGISAGERALVARFIGGGDIAGANRVVGQAFVISAVYGVLVALVGILFTTQIFSLFNLEAAASAEGAAYLRIVLTFWVTEAFWITSFSIMQASGDPMTPMKIAVFIRVVNAVIYPVLILGWWIFPRLGVRGAAISYIITTTLGMTICLWIFFTGRTRLRLTLKELYPDYRLMWRIMRIGIPGSAMGLGKTFGDLVLTSFMIPFGTLALAVHNSIFRIESFINAPGLGLGFGSGVLVGQNLGAGQPRQAARSGWLALGLVAGFMICCSVLLFVWSDSIMGFFSVDPDFVKLGSAFLHIAITGYLAMSIVYVMQNCIPGSGDTMTPMFITLAMYWIVQLPLAFYLSKYTGLGAYGVRWAIVISFTLGAIVYIAHFWRGKWKDKKI
jgi:putative MATE family efflux protein